MGVIDLLSEGAIVTTRLDKLVNAYLDGTIEKDIYIMKKDEIIKHKTDLEEKRSAMRKKGNNWLEPLTEWITTLKHAQKLGIKTEIIDLTPVLESFDSYKKRDSVIKELFPEEPLFTYSPALL